MRWCVPPWGRVVRRRNATGRIGERPERNFCPERAAGSTMEPVLARLASTLGRPV